MQRAKFFTLPIFALATIALAVPAHARAEEGAAEATSAEAEAAADAMEDSWNIIQNATSSPEHKTLVQAFVAAGLVETLSGAGPFTVFAPTDAAFAAVPQRTESLMEPSNRASLAQVLTYHVVPGRLTAIDLSDKIKAGGGTAKIETVAGQELTFSEVQGNIKIDGAEGSAAYITKADVAQSNGVMHVVNGVLIPTTPPPPAAEPAADSASPVTEATPAG